MATEDFCGVPQDCDERETGSGTEYRICKWTCPGCGKACSMLEIDGEWCHGDSLCISFIDGVRSVGCTACLQQKASALPMQLPPLTDVMYHACRGIEYEFTAGGPSSVIGYFDDDMLDEIWEQINTALRCSSAGSTHADATNKADR